MIDDSQIRNLAKKRSVAFKKHALVRIIERRINVDEVLTALELCETIQEYQNDKPLPSRLVLGFGNNRPLHAVVAVDDEMLWVITAYIPSLDIWNKDFKTRKKPL